MVAELCHESQGLPQDYNCCIALAQVTEPTARFRPEIAFTFDDPKIDSAAGLSCQETNRRILEVLDKRKVKAVLFVCGKRVDNVDGQRLIASWERAGHDIGNHSYSHRNFNFSGNDNSGPSGVTLSEFEAGTLKNEDLIRGYSHFVRLFRFPFFKEGDTLEKRDGMRSFLRQHDYRIGRATVDASDWAINTRLENRLKLDAKADLGPYRRFFLQHVWERAQLNLLLSACGNTLCVTRCYYITMHSTPFPR